MHKEGLIGEQETNGINLPETGVGERAVQSKRHRRETTQHTFLNLKFCACYQHDLTKFSKK